jgi:hypothetical protein
MKRDIARRADHTVFATVLEVPIENRFDGLAALMEALLNEAISRLFFPAGSFSFNSPSAARFTGCLGSIGRVGGGGGGGGGGCDGGDGGGGGGCGSGGGGGIGNGSEITTIGISSES